jgi:hypothetical protein
MTRRLPVLLLLVVALALPAGAEARTAKVRVPEEGNLTVAQYRAKVPRGTSPTVRIANRRRLGDTKVIVAVARLRGRRYEVTVVAMNPSSATAALDTPTPQVFIETRFVLVRRSFLDDMLDGLERTDLGFGKFCQSPSSSGARSPDFSGRMIGAPRNVFRASGILLCRQVAPHLVDEIDRARRRLTGNGLSVPPCSGRTSSFKDSPREMVVVLACASRTDVVAVLAEDGNVGTNCLAAQGTICQFGQGCQPLPPESVCYFRPDGFLPGDVHTVRGEWTQLPAFPTGMSLDPGGQSTTPVLLFPLMRN